MNLASLLFSLVFAASPRGSSYAPESGEELEARYAAIVSDALDVGRERPLPGLSGRQTAVVLLAVAHRESGFARDVDEGRCAATEHGRCDSGRAVCLLQVQPRTTEQRAEIEHDRKACFRAGLAIMRGGWERCPRTPFAVFSGGSCESSAALRGGREIQGFVRRWMSRVEGGSS